MAEEITKTGAEDTNPTPGTEETKSTYTQEEVEALLQKETDKRISEAMAKAERKKNAAVKEATKLAAMNEQEKYEYELKRREEAIVEKERALALSENKNEASKILAEKGISLSLVDFIVAEDAETMSANIALLDKAFKASVKAEVEKRISSTTPKKNLPLDGAITRDSIKKMSVGELNELYRNNPELYKSLMQG